MTTISDAQYVDATTVRAEFDGVVQFVPADPANAHWQAIQAAVAAEELTIAAAPPPPSHEITRLKIVDRLLAAGLWGAAVTAMQADTPSNPGGAAWYRFWAATGILSDDPTLLAMLVAIDASPEQIAIITAP